MANGWDKFGFIQEYSSQQIALQPVVLFSGGKTSGLTISRDAGPCRVCLGGCDFAIRFHRGRATPGSFVLPAIERERCA